MSTFSRVAVMAALGDYYDDNSTGYTALPFVYKNVTDFQSYLGGKSWVTPISLSDTVASKTNILTKLKEEIGKLGTDDWLIFYYTGHGALLDPGTGPANIKAYCVTYAPDLRYNFFPGIIAFLSEDDYATVVKEFGDQSPNGHLITILDCCNAFGLIDSFAEQKPYHTVIAATSKNTSAFYNTNSAFFSAFSQVWDTPLEDLQDAINQKMTAMGAPNACIVKVAANFKQATL